MPDSRFLSIVTTSGYVGWVSFLAHGKGNERGFDGVSNLRYEDKSWVGEIDGECAWILIQVGDCFCLCDFFYNRFASDLSCSEKSHKCEMKATCLLKFNGKVSL